ncbi:PKD domain-containing protein [Candidatus Woesearchaeota archaeon]|nr:PKD domain-containing protein [Candidatus Woesearchaeota archaeon]
MKKISFILLGLICLFPFSSAADVSARLTVGWVNVFNTLHTGVACIENTDRFGPFDNIILEYTYDDHSGSPPSPTSLNMADLGGNIYCADLQPQYWDAASPADTLASAKITVKSGADITFQDNPWQTDVPTAVDDSNHIFHDMRPKKIIVNEFEANPAGTDSGNEWIELYNPNNEEVDISGWTLTDSGSDVYTAAAATKMAANSYLVIDTGLSIVNNNEEIILADSAGAEIDRTAIKSDSSNDGRSWSRLPDATDTDSDTDWTFQTATKGWSNNDKDNDGYEDASLPVNGNDCDDSDAAVNPGAAEVCDNGLDDDCDGNVDCADDDCDGLTGSGGIICCQSSASCSSLDAACAAGTCNLGTNVCEQTLHPITTECRASAGVCDAAEYCTGSSPSCPADSVEPSTTECRASAGVCDAAEYCDGSSVDCPADSFEPASKECRPSADVCDTAEFCSGASALCPADVFEPSSAICRPSAGACDLAESCTGSSPSCPSDAKSTAVCRAATDSCDLAESCDGVNDDCPADNKAPAGTSCGLARDCPDDTCNGLFGEFYPVDGHDSCDGFGTCIQYSCQITASYCADNDPNDGINSLQCGAKCDQDSDCFANEVCDTVSCQCVESQCIGKADGTACDNGLYCDGADECQNEQCITAGNAIDCSGNDLSAISTCDNVPDDNPFTFDFYGGFTSQCDEATDSCTTGKVTLTHNCDISQCGAECETNAGCSPTDCDSNDGCVAGTYRDYHDEPNACTASCACETNACNTYDNVITDADGDTYDTECDGDCDDGNANVNPGAAEDCSNNIDDDCDGHIDGADPDCFACTSDNDCANLDDQCNDGRCDLNSHTCYKDPKSVGTSCDDGLYCTVNDECSSGKCTGAARDCSGNDLSAISTCDNVPDDNPFTFDFYGGFTSQCDEATDSCTTGKVTLTHNCDISQCGAECETNAGCSPTDCDSNDGCYSGIYRDYHDVDNACSSCSCEQNSCTVYDEDTNDPRCGAVADANGPYKCDEGSSIKLDGSGSYSNDGTITSYEWDTDNDGSFDDATGIAPVYDCADDYDDKARLRVTDSNGKEGIDSVDLTVNNADPKADADGPSEGDVGVAIDFDGDASDVPADTLSYAWDFGDGATSDKEDPSHMYSSPGIYTVKLTVTDDDGGSDTDSLNIEIFGSVKIALDKGISMFSLPVIPAKQISFNDIQRGCKFAVKDGLAYWNPHKQQYNMLFGTETLYPGQGYFVNLEDDCSLVVRGEAFDYDDNVVGYDGSGQLIKGWNMIGSASKRSHYWYVKNDCEVTSGPWGADQSSNDFYYLTAFLEPGEGYWLKVKDDCSLDGKART